MGSLEHLSILLEGLLLALLAGLQLAKIRHGTYLVLALLWAGLALFDFSLLLFPGWTTWAKWGSYFIFITAMAYIAIFQHSSKVSPHSGPLP